MRFPSTEKLVALGLDARRRDGERPRLIDVVVWFAVGATLAAVSYGCSGPLTMACHDRADRPYTSEHPTQVFVSWPASSWFADGGPTALTVHNPTSSFQQVHVTCHPTISSVTSIDYGHVEWWTCLEAHQEKARLVEFMNVDSLISVCEVDQSYAVGRRFCYQHDE